MNIFSRFLQILFRREGLENLALRLGVRKRPSWVLVVGLALLLTILFVGCGERASAPTKTIRYTNNELGFSLEYPKTWVRADISRYEIALRHPKEEYTLIRVSAVPRWPLLPAELRRNIVGAFLKEQILSYGGRNIDVSVEQSSGKWDWVAIGSFVRRDTPTFMAIHIKHTLSITYILWVIHPTNVDFAEGWAVANSFTIIAESQEAPRLPSEPSPTAPASPLEALVPPIETGLGSILVDPVAPFPGGHFFVYGSGFFVPTVVLQWTYIQHFERKIPDQVTFVVELKPDEQGTFSFKMDIPPHIKSGTYSVNAWVPDAVKGRIVATTRVEVRQ